MPRRSDKWTGEMNHRHMIATIRAVEDPSVMTKIAEAALLEINRKDLWFDLGQNRAGHPTWCGEGPAPHEIRKAIWLGHMGAQGVDPRASRMYCPITGGWPPPESYIHGCFSTCTCQ